MINLKSAHHSTLSRKFNKSGEKKAKAEGIAEKLNRNSKLNANVSINVIPQITVLLHHMQQYEAL